MTIAESRDWHPSRQDIVTWTVLSLALMVVGLFAFTAVWSIRWGESSFEFAGLEVLVALGVTLALVVLLLVAHEGLHGLTAKRYGGVPRYGVTMVGRVLPAFYCTCPGHRFTRGQFVVILLMPFVVVTLVCLAVLLLGRWSGWLVVPAAIHLSGCIGDFAMVAIVARVSRGTLVEDRMSGMRFHRRG